MYIQYFGSVNFIFGIYDVCNQAGLGCIVSCALLVISIGIFSAVYSSVVGFGNYHHHPSSASTFSLFTFLGGFPSGTRTRLDFKSFNPIFPYCPQESQKKLLPIIINFHQLSPIITNHLPLSPIINQL